MMKRKKPSRFLGIGLLILVLLASSTFAFGARKKALLIGINDYKNLPFYSSETKSTFDDLMGSGNDVQAILKILVSRYGFREKEDIRVLRDYEATRAGILKVFDSWLIQGTEPGDMAFFFYSGHGSQVPDENGDEADGKDEALCAYDVVVDGASEVEEANVILDDELAALFRKLEGRDVVGIIDSCHAATLPTRGIASKVRSIPIRLAKKVSRPRGAAANTENRDDLFPPGQVFIYSSREDQKSLEMAFPDGFHGAMAQALLETLREQRDLTYRQLFDGASKIVKDRYKLSQDPQIEPISGQVLEKPIFISSVPAQAKKPADKPAAKPPAVPAAGVQVKPTAPAPKPEAKAPPTQPVVPKPPAELAEERLLVRFLDIQGGTRDQKAALLAEMKRADFIRLTEEPFFDRIVETEFKAGAFKTRLLNRLDEAIDIPAAKTIPELAAKILPSLETDHILKRLARLRHPNPPFKVRVWVADEKRREFRLGEKITYNLQSDEDAYVLLLNVDVAGNFHVIFPNAYHPENSVKGGQVVTIPDENMRKREFVFEFGEPAGEETVKLIATKERLTVAELGIEKFELYFLNNGIAALQGKTRAILVKKAEEALASGRFRWSEDTVVVRSRK